MSWPAVGTITCSPSPPTGVESFYALAEEKASKGVADYLMLRRKLPDEIFDGRRTLPGSLFRRDDVASYLANLDRALDQTFGELGPEGGVDVFDLTRRLGHRMGLASWAGPGSAEGEAFERLVRALDTLDGSDAFVHPDAMAAVAASNKRAERAALEVVAEVVETAVRRLDSGDMADQAFFGRIVDAWASESPRVRMRGIALDIALIHIAAMSNLASALGWALVDMLERLAQRSILARTVLTPVSFDTGDTTYQVPPGWTIATLLPLLNTSVAPGLEHWDPDRWTRHRLRKQSALPSPVLVTAFGHGRHSCPAQPFSLSAMTAAITDLLGRYDMVPGWTTYPQPVPAQIGGVARACGPCPVSYVSRTA